MTRIFALCNNKGGVTKTTTAVNLGYGLARAGKRVLLVDTDAQSNSTYSLLGTLDQEQTLFDVLTQGAKMTDILVESVGQKGLFVAPSSINLSAADLLMASAPGREHKLARSLSQVKENFDYILIDTPPIWES
ncbi:hypothetical protein KDK_71190 [Dictyobacter kobayashii]|uniref:AAA domain-containing protein n=1 Tax=Dictyobacter kobayashii TaxID=2014872 RepID=A0A402AW55_9CHLR|nr:hypothetical protein KDK_71190 [Dictyobacter kobayashii]